MNYLLGVRGGVKDIKCAFVTGGTGLLGINIVKELIQNTSAKIILLVRNPTQEKRDKFKYVLRVNLLWIT